MSPEKDAGEQALADRLRPLGQVAVAFSGGVDSACLLAAAVRILGRENVWAITGVSPTLAGWEKEEARSLGRQLGVRHILLDTDEFSNPAYTANPADRCYHCKKALFRVLTDWASKHGIPWVVEGSNVDDRSDYRPGRRALAEMPSVRSPLMEAGLRKADIRALSRAWGLPTADRPANACLASRVQYGLPLTPERLRQVEAAEHVIRPLCRGSLRVRHHGDLARIEVGADEIPVLAEPETARKISAELKQLGFHHVALDLTGYRTGSMNASLPEAARANPDMGPADTTRSTSVQHETT